MSMTSINSTDKIKMEETISTRKERDSNLELLRCIAMLLVVLVHTGFLSLGLPTQEETFHSPISVFMRFLTQSVSVVCVNVFILLSGWYGIRFDLKRLGKFLFQVLFFSILIYSCLVVIHPNVYLNTRSLSMVFMLNGEDYWFVKSYVLLYLFAPMLNAFIENRDNHKIAKYVLAIFLLFQTIFSWLSIRGAFELEGGYSALSFMGLYLLIRYLRCYGCEPSKYSFKQYISSFCGIVLLNALLAFFLARMNIIVFGRIFTYTNPLVICQSLLLIYGFSQISIKSRFINWIAISCFAVYLTHSNGFLLRPYYGKWIKSLFMTQDTFCFITYATFTIALIFFVSILLDKIRIYLWTLIVKNK